MIEDRANSAMHLFKSDRFLRYVAIVGYMSYTDLRAESERTYVGFLWWIVEPAVSLLVYYVVFGLFLIRNIDNYVVFLFVGLVPWRWLHTTVLHGSTSILSAKGLMRQVYLPKVVFPAVAFATNTFKFLVVFLLVVAIVALAGFPLTWQYLWLPVVLAVQAALIAGVTLFSAAFTPFLPDLRIVLENLIRLWFFLSGIFYEVGAFAESSQALFRLNPMVVIIESYRDILMHGSPPALAHLLLIGVVSLVVCIGGVKLLIANDYRYPKLAF